MFYRKILIAGLVSVFSLTAAASGSTGGHYRNLPKVQTDPVYEKGKKLFKGRTKAYGKVKFCFLDEEKAGAVKKIKRSTLKAYKGKKYNDLAKALYRCDDTSKAIYQVLNRDDLFIYLYFVNNRFKLHLS